MKRAIAITILGALSGCFALMPQIKVRAQSTGHSGPVRALAITPDGNNAISGSTDASAIYWSLTSNVAEQVLRFHKSAVNAVAFGPNNRIFTAGNDGRLALWAPGGQIPVRALEGHTGPILGLAISPDSKFIASASADRTIRIWPLAGGNPFVFLGHKQAVNGVAFIDAKTFVSVSDDMTLQIWPLFGGVPLTVTLPTELNAVAVSSHALIIVGGASGHVFCFTRDGERTARITTDGGPITSVAPSPDGNLVAAATMRGSVAIMEPQTRKLARTLSAPGLPVWSTAFLPDSRMLLTGGIDHKIRRWDAITGQHIGLIGQE
jgi:cytochrome c